MQTSSICKQTKRKNQATRFARDKKQENKRQEKTKSSKIVIEQLQCFYLVSSIYVSCILIEQATKSKG